MFPLLMGLRCVVTHICHNSVADMVQMFSSVLVATHEPEQLEEEASGKRRRTKQPSEIFPLAMRGLQKGLTHRRRFLSRSSSLEMTVRTKGASRTQRPPGFESFASNNRPCYLTEERRVGEAPRGCLAHKFTAINSCRCFSPIYHQHRTKYDGHFLPSVCVHGKGSRDKTQVHLK